MWKQEFHALFLWMTAEAERLCAWPTCRHRVTRLCVEATRTLAEASGGSVVFEGRPWNSNTVDLIRLARAHCLLVLHSTFADSVAKLAAEVRAWGCACNHGFGPHRGLASTQIKVWLGRRLDSPYGCWAKCWTSCCKKVRIKVQRATALTIGLTGRPAKCARENPKRQQVGTAAAQASVAAPAAAAVSKLVSLFGLSFIAREAGDFLEDGYLSGQQVRAMPVTLHGASICLHELPGVSCAHG